MELVFKKLGDSIGLIFPDSFMHEHGLREGQVVHVDFKSDGSLVFHPKSTRKHYSAKELNALCDFDAPLTQDTMDW